MSIFGKEEPEVVTVLDKPLRCQVCSADRFYTRKAQLHGAVASFFDLEWTGPSCTCVICSRCSYVHWFLPEV
jgi:hypothetical protein